MGGLFVLPKMHKITQNSLLKKHGIFCLTFSRSAGTQISLVILPDIVYNTIDYAMTETIFQTQLCRKDARI